MVTSGCCGQDAGAAGHVEELDHILAQAECPPFVVASQVREPYTRSHAPETQNPDPDTLQPKPEP